MGGHMAVLLENLNEIRHIVKAAIGTDLLHRLAVLQPQAGIGYPDTVEIAKVGDAGELLEPAAKIEFAVAHHPGYLV